jgi:CubicO group peptidase (beta-lactamase class C family)
VTCAPAIALCLLLLVPAPGRAGADSLRLAADHTLGRIFVEAVNIDSPARRNEFIPAIFSAAALNSPGPERLGGLLERIHEDYAPLDYHHAERREFNLPGGRSAVLHIYARKRGAAMWTDFQMRLDPEPPHRILSLGFIAEVSEPVALPNGTIDQRETLEWLDGYITRLNAEYDLSGGLLIAKGGTVLLERYFGTANIREGLSVTRGTRFNLASGGKMFVALAIAQLAEEGRLRYEDPVSLFVGGFADTARARRTTIHHLLAHTSGLKEYWSGEATAAVAAARTTSEHLAIVLRAGYVREPGTVYEYCNSNYIVLGAIIERVAGRSFDDHLRNRIFVPAGMVNTGYIDHGTAAAAIPYARMEDGRSWKEARHGKRGSAAGGAYSTGEDLLRFSRALEENLLVSGTTRQRMTTAQNAQLRGPADFEYGYGFILAGTGNSRSYGHGGTADGVNFEFRRFPAENITLVVFSNQNNGAYDDLKRSAIRLISGER